jgi:hypothetical protein
MSLLYKRPTPEYAMHLLSFFPSRPGYDFWLQIISEIGNTFPDENEAIRILHSHFKDEKPNETLYKIRRRLKDFNFGTIIYYANLYGYRPDFDYDFLNKSRKDHHYNDDECIPLVNLDKMHCFSFDDNAFKERSASYQYKAGMSRPEADNRVINENPNVAHKRAYRIAANNAIVDKNLEPDTLLYNHNGLLLTNNFHNEVLTVDQIIDVVGSGHAICPCVLKENEQQKTKRSEENWIGSEMIALDIDSGLGIDDVLESVMAQFAIMLYTTVNHDKINHRFRIIYPLEHFECNKMRYRRILRKFILASSADKNCSDVARMYYGNRNAYVIDFVNHKEYQFIDGVKHETRIQRLDY